MAKGTCGRNALADGDPGKNQGTGSESLRGNAQLIGRSFARVKSWHGVGINSKARASDAGLEILSCT